MLIVVTHSWAQDDETATFLHFVSAPEGLSIKCPFARIGPMTSSTHRVPKRGILFCARKRTEPERSGERDLQRSHLLIQYVQSISAIVLIKFNNNKLWQHRECS